MIPSITVIAFPEFLRSALHPPIGLKAARIAPDAPPGRFSPMPSL
jgi:hypothetical protein